MEAQQASTGASTKRPTVKISKGIKSQRNEHTRKARDNKMSASFTNGVKCNKMHISFGVDDILRDLESLELSKLNQRANGNKIPTSSSKVNENKISTSFADKAKANKMTTSFVKRTNGNKIPISSNKVNENEISNSQRVNGNKIPTSSNGANGNKIPTSSNRVNGNKIPTSSKRTNGNKIPTSSNQVNGNKIPNSQKRVNGNKIPNSSTKRFNNKPRKPRPYVFKLCYKHLAQWNRVDNFKNKNCIEIVNTISKVDKCKTLHQIYLECISTKKRDIECKYVGCSHINLIGLYKRKIEDIKVVKKQPEYQNDFYYYPYDNYEVRYPLKPAQKKKHLPGVKIDKPDTTKSAPKKRISIEVPKKMDYENIPIAIDEEPRVDSKLDDIEVFQQKLQRTLLVNKLRSKYQHREPTVPLSLKKELSKYNLTLNESDITSAEITTITETLISTWCIDVYYGCLITSLLTNLVANIVSIATLNKTTKKHRYAVYTAMASSLASVLFTGLIAKEHYKEDVKKKQDDIVECLNKSLKTFIEGKQIVSETVVPEKVEVVQTTQAIIEEMQQNSVEVEEAIMESDSSETSSLVGSIISQVLNQEDSIEELYEKLDLAINENQSLEAINEIRNSLGLGEFIEEKVIVDQDYCDCRRPVKGMQDYFCFTKDTECVKAYNCKKCKKLVMKEDDDVPKWPYDEFFYSNMMSKGNSEFAAAVYADHFGNKLSEISEDIATFDKTRREIFKNLRSTQNPEGYSDTEKEEKLMLLKQQIELWEHTNSIITSTEFAILDDIKQVISMHAPTAQEYDIVINNITNKQLKEYTNTEFGRQAKELYNSTIESQMDASTASHHAITILFGIAGIFLVAFGINSSKILKNVPNAFSFISNIIKDGKTAYEGLLCFVQETIFGVASVKSDASDYIAKLVVKLSELSAKPFTAFLDEPTFSKDFKKTLEEAQAVIQTSKSSPQVSTLVSSFIVAQKRYSEMVVTVEAQGIRVKPVNICVTGPGRIGKTTANTELCKFIAEGRYQQTEIYSINPNEKYWQPYIGQYCAQVEELGNTSPLSSQYIRDHNQIYGTKAFNLEGAFAKVQPCAFKLVCEDLNKTFQEWKEQLAGTVIEREGIRSFFDRKYMFIASAVGLNGKGIMTTGYKEDCSHIRYTPIMAKHHQQYDIEFIETNVQIGDKTFSKLNIEDMKRFIDEKLDKNFKEYKVHEEKLRQALINKEKSLTTVSQSKGHHIVYNFQGKPGSGKTRLINKMCGRLQFLGYEIVKYEDAKKNLPTKPCCLVVDDVFLDDNSTAEEASYISVYNNLPGPSIILVGTNRQCVKVSKFKAVSNSTLTSMATIRESIKVMYKPLYENVAMYRRLGYNGKFLHGKQVITTSNDHAYAVNAFQFTNMQSGKNVSEDSIVHSMNDKIITTNDTEFRILHVQCDLKPVDPTIHIHFKSMVELKNALRSPTSILRCMKSSKDMLKGGYGIFVHDKILKFNVATPDVGALTWNGDVKTHKDLEELATRYIKVFNTMGIDGEIYVEIDDVGQLLAVGSDIQLRTNEGLRKIVKRVRLIPETQIIACESYDPADVSNVKMHYSFTLPEYLRLFRIDEIPPYTRVKYDGWIELLSSFVPPKPNAAITAHDVQMSRTKLKLSLARNMIKTKEFLRKYGWWIAGITALSAFLGVIYLSVKSDKPPHEDLLHYKSCLVNGMNVPTEYRYVRKWIDQQPNDYKTMFNEQVVNERKGKNSVDSSETGKARQYLNDAYEVRRKIRNKLRAAQDDDERAYYMDKMDANTFELDKAKFFIRSRGGKVDEDPWDDDTYNEAIYNAPEKDPKQEQFDDLVSQIKQNDPELYEKLKFNIPKSEFVCHPTHADDVDNPALKEYHSVEANMCIVDTSLGTAWGVFVKGRIVLTLRHIIASPRGYAKHVRVNFDVMKGYSDYTRMEYSCKIIHVSEYYDYALVEVTDTKCQVFKDITSKFVDKEGFFGDCVTNGKIKGIDCTLIRKSKQTVYSINVTANGLIPSFKTNSFDNIPADNVIALNHKGSGKVTANGDCGQPLFLNEFAKRQLPCFLGIHIAADTASNFLYSQIVFKQDLVKAIENPTLADGFMNKPKEVPKPIEQKPVEQKQPESKTKCDWCNGKYKWGQDLQMNKTMFVSSSADVKYGPQVAEFCAIYSCKYSDIKGDPIEFAAKKVLDACDKKNLPKGNTVFVLNTTYSHKMNKCFHAKFEYFSFNKSPALMAAFLDIFKPSEANSLGIINLNNNLYNSDAKQRKRFKKLIRANGANHQATLKPEYIDDFSELIEQAKEMPYDPITTFPNGNVEIVGTISYDVAGEIYSSHVKSPYYDIALNQLGEPQKVPVLHPSQYNQEQKDSIDKDIYGRNDKILHQIHMSDENLPIPSQNTINNIADEMQHWFDTYFGRFCEFSTDKEVLDGIANPLDELNCVYNGIDTAKSSGGFLKIVKGVAPKSAYIKTFEDGHREWLTTNRANYVKEAYDWCKEEVKNKNFRIPNLYMCCEKDELLPPEKCHKGRIFYAGDLLLVLLERLVVGKIVAASTLNRWEVPCRVGIDALTDWNDFIAYHYKPGQLWTSEKDFHKYVKHSSGDCSRWDKRCNPAYYEILKIMARRSAHKFSKNPEPWINAFENICDANCNANLLVRNMILKVNRGMPSGSLTTAAFNSFFLTIMYYAAFRSLTGKNSFSEFQQLCSFSAYGDDSLLSTHECICEDYNLQTISAFVKKTFGAVLDTDRKDGAMYKYYNDIDQTTFISRHPVYHNNLGMWTGALKKASLEAAFYWNRQNTGGKMYWAQIINNTLISAACWGRAYYEKIRNVASQICARNNELSELVDLPSYSYQLILIGSKTITKGLHVRNYSQYDNSTNCSSEAFKNIKMPNYVGILNEYRALNKIAFIEPYTFVRENTTCDTWTCKAKICKLPSLMQSPQMSSSASDKKNAEQGVAALLCAWYDQSGIYNQSDKPSASGEAPQPAAAMVGETAPTPNHAEMLQPSLNVVGQTYLNDSSFAGIRTVESIGSARLKIPRGGNLISGFLNQVSQIAEKTITTTTAVKDKLFEFSTMSILQSFTPMLKGVIESHQFVQPHFKVRLYNDAATGQKGSIRVFKSATPLDTANVTPGQELTEFSQIASYTDYSFDGPLETLIDMKPIANINNAPNVISGKYTQQPDQDVYYTVYLRNSVGTTFNADASQANITFRAEAKLGEAFQISNPIKTMDMIAKEAYATTATAPLMLPVVDSNIDWPVEKISFVVEATTSYDLTYPSEIVKLPPITSNFTMPELNRENIIGYSQQRVIITTRHELNIVESRGPSVNAYQYVPIYCYGNIPKTVYDYFNAGGKIPETESDLEFFRNLAGINAMNQVGSSQSASADQMYYCESDIHELGDELGYQLGITTEQPSAFHPTERIFVNGENNNFDVKYNDHRRYYQIWRMQTGNLCWTMLFPSQISVVCQESIVSPNNKLVYCWQLPAHHTSLASPATWLSITTLIKNQDLQYRCWPLEPGFFITNTPPLYNVPARSSEWEEVMWKPPVINKKTNLTTDGSYIFVPKITLPLQVNRGFYSASSIRYNSVKILDIPSIKLTSGPTAASSMAYNTLVAFCMDYINKTSAAEIHFSISRNKTVILECAFNLEEGLMANTNRQNVQLQDIESKNLTITNIRQQVGAIPQTNVDTWINYYESGLAVKKATTRRRVVNQMLSAFTQIGGGMLSGIGQGIATVNQNQQAQLDRQNALNLANINNSGALERVLATGSNSLASIRVQGEQNRETQLNQISASLDAKKQLLGIQSDSGNALGMNTSTRESDSQIKKAFKQLPGNGTIEQTGLTDRDFGFNKYNTSSVQATNPLVSADGDNWGETSDGSNENWGDYDNGNF